MTYHDMDPNRRGTDPYATRPHTSERGFGWGIPLAIAAVVLIAGMLFFNSSNNSTTTASNDAPVTRQTNPSTPVPGPAPATPPAKTQ